MKRRNDKILLFIPGYNCEKQITRVLKQIDKEVQKYVNEIIVVNNRSTDGTERAVLDFKSKASKGFPVLKLLRNDNNYNLGGSHKVAFDYAMQNGFDYVIVLHGDDQGNIHDLLSILCGGEYDKYDAVLGARFMRGARLDGYSKFRTFGNRVYNWLFSIVVRKRIYDLGSGLNMYKVESLKSKYYLKFPDRLTFNYCMVMAINYYKQKVKFFPISWRESDQASNVKLVNQGFDVLGMLWKYFWCHKFITKELRAEPVKKYTFKEIGDEK